MVEGLGAGNCSICVSLAPNPSSLAPPPFHPETAEKSTGISPIGGILVVFVVKKEFSFRSSRDADRDGTRSGVVENSGELVARRAGRQNVVDKQDVFSLQESTSLRSDVERPQNVVDPIPARQRILQVRSPNPTHDIAKMRPLQSKGQFLRQSVRIVDAPLPTPEPVHRYGNDHVDFRGFQQTPSPLDEPRRERRRQKTGAVRFHPQHRPTEIVFVLAQRDHPAKQERRRHAASAAVASGEPFELSTAATFTEFVVRRRDRLPTRHAKRNAVVAVKKLPTDRAVRRTNKIKKLSEQAVGPPAKQELPLRRRNPRDGRSAPDLAGACHEKFHNLECQWNRNCS